MIILVVDDEERLAAAVARILEAAGHQVFMAHDVEGALVVAQRERPHAVITDYELGHRLGSELIQLLRSKGLARVFLVLTGRHDCVLPSDLAEVVVLRKPCPSETLLSALEAALGA